MEGVAFDDFGAAVDVGEDGSAGVFVAAALEVAD